MQSAQHNAINKSSINDTIFKQLIFKSKKLKCLIFFWDFTCILHHLYFFPFMYEHMLYIWIILHKINNQTLLHIWSYFNPKINFYIRTDTVGSLSEINCNPNKSELVMVRVRLWLQKKIKWFFFKVLCL